MRRLRPGAGTSRIFAPGHGYMILTGGINASMVKEHFVIIGDTGTIVIPVTVQNYMDHLENNDQETSGFVWSRGFWLGFWVRVAGWNVQSTSI